MIGGMFMKCVLIVFFIKILNFMKIIFHTKRLVMRKFTILVME